MKGLFVLEFRTVADLRAALALAESFGCADTDSIRLVVSRAEGRLVVSGIEIETEGPAFRAPRADGFAVSPSGA